MPKKIDPKVKGRCVRQVLEHLHEYPSLAAAAETVARREGLYGRRKTTTPVRRSTPGASRSLEW